MTRLGGICRPGSISLDVARGRWGLISPAGTPVRFRISWCRARTVSINPGVVNPEVPGLAWPIVAVGRRFVPGGEKSPAGFGVAMLLVSLRVRAWSPRGVVASVSHKDRDALFHWDSWGVAWPAHDMNQCPGSTRAYSRMSVSGNGQAITGLITPVSHKDRDVSCPLDRQAMPGGVTVRGLMLHYDIKVSRQVARWYRGGYPLSRSRSETSGGQMPGRARPSPGWSLRCRTRTEMRYFPGTPGASLGRLTT